MRWALLSLALPFLACSHSKAPAPDAGPTDAGVCGGFTGAGVAPATVCADLLRAVCDRYERCGLSDPAWRATCLALSADQSGCNQAALDQGRFRLDAAKAQCCISVTQSAGCTGDGFERVREACDPGLELPNVAPGSACDDSRECIPADDAGHTGCFRSWEQTSCGGTCSAGVHLGERCSAYPGLYCLEGYCDFDGTTGLGVCRAYPALGASCGGTTPCSPDAFCASGACVPRGGVGGTCSDESCQPGLHCFSGHCAAEAQLGASCDASDPRACAGFTQCLGGHCAPRYANPGEACGNGIGCTDSFCDNDGGGTCRPEPGLGQPCRDNFCGWGFDCDSASQTCVNRPALGQACPTSACRVGLICDRQGATCVPQPAPGEACAGGLFSGCQSGYCDADAGTCQPFHAPFTGCVDDYQCAAVSDAHTCRATTDGGPKVCTWCGTH